MKLHIDIETFSSVDLKACGVARYAESADFEILLLGYAFDDKPRKVVDIAQGEDIPTAVLEALTDYNVRKKAFNANFEMTCLAQWLKFPMPPEQWECTAVHALYLGLPGSLDGVCTALDVPEKYRKQKTGNALIRLFTVPCRPTKKNGGRTRNLPRHEPEKWQLFKEYCGQDVDAERYVAEAMAKHKVPKKERDLWVLDQHMFKRGVGVDVNLVEAAMHCDNVGREDLIRQAIEITRVTNPNSTAQLKEWLEKEMGTEVADLRKKTIPKLIEISNTDAVEKVLRLRQEISKSSVKKYQAMARSVCEDGRLRGVTQFYGANRTGRWAGRIVQLQNLPQNHLPDLFLARDLVKEKDPGLIDTLFGSVPDVLSQLIRTALVPEAGKIFIACDFSAIEARVIAWMAGCRWRMDVFETHGKIYEASAEKMFKLEPGSVTKKSPYRQKGKIAELALGFQGGVNAMVNMGALDMGLSNEELQPIVDAWRSANPEIVKLWGDVEKGMREAIKTGLKVQMYIAEKKSRIVFEMKDSFLTVRLPSGRSLYYANARLEPENIEGPVPIRAGAITYEGVDQKTRRWCRMATFGGRAVENLVQAIARDCLAESMLALDAAGFTQVFSVHDEIIAEESTDRLVEMEQIMSRPISWAPGLPLNADGFTTEYYMKEME
jgi:DNA polymerase